MFPSVLFAVHHLHVSRGAAIPSLLIVTFILATHRWLGLKQGVQRGKIAVRSTYLRWFSRGCPLSTLRLVSKIFLKQHFVLRESVIGIERLLVRIPLRAVSLSPFPELARVLRLRSNIRLGRKAVGQKIQLLWEQLHRRTVSLCLVSIAPARFLRDTTHCPVVASKSVCPTTEPNSGSGPLKCWDQSRVFPI